MCSIVPVIAIFTKFDALVVKAFGTLRGEGTPLREARILAAGHAKADLEKIYSKLRTMKYPPKAIVFLQGQRFHLDIKPVILNSFPDMHKPDADCRKLMEETAAALDSKILQQLFVSTQRKNLELCIKYAIRRYITPF